MNKFRANWLKKRISFREDGPRLPYKMAKKWWESLSNGERKKYCNYKDLKQVIGDWYTGVKS